MPLHQVLGDVVVTVCRSYVNKIFFTTSCFECMRRWRPLCTEWAFSKERKSGRQEKGESSPEVGLCKRWWSVRPSWLSRLSVWSMFGSMNHKWTLVAVSIAGTVSVCVARCTLCTSAVKVTVSLNSRQESIKNLCNIMLGLFSLSDPT